MLQDVLFYLLSYVLFENDKQLRSCVNITAFVNVDRLCYNFFFTEVISIDQKYYVFAILQLFAYIHAINVIMLQEGDSLDYKHIGIFYMIYGYIYLYYIHHGFG